MRSDFRVPPAPGQNGDDAASNGAVVGARFGHWTINSIQFRRAWCRCDCGVQRQMAVDALLGGESSSCGCALPNATEIRFVKPTRLIDWRPKR